MDIVKLVSQFATPGMLGQVSGLLGMSPEAAQKGFGAAVPAVLAALLGAAKASGAADKLGAALTKAGGLTGDPSAAAASGSGLLASILGPEAGTALSGAIGKYAGIESGAGSLLGLAGTMALGTLGKAAGDKGAAGVFGLLEQNKAQISAAMPADLAKALGAAGLLGGLGAPAAAAAPKVVKAAAKPAAAAAVPRPVAPPPPKKSGMMRYLLWIVVAALVIWFLMRLIAPAPPPPPPPAEPAPAAAPAAPAPAEPAPAPAAPAPVEPAPVPAAPAPAEPAPVPEPAAPAPGTAPAPSSGG